MSTIGSKQYALTCANRIRLDAMTPRSELASTEYCLANPGTEYLVYQPKSGEIFSVELKAAMYCYEWFDPARGTTAGNGGIKSSGGPQQFKAPLTETLWCISRRNEAF